MDYKEYIELGLNGEAPLKIILSAHIDEMNDDKVGVVSLVFATTNKQSAKKKIEELINLNKESGNYYMVYSVPMDTDLTKLEHYPSIAVTKDDLK